MVKNDGGPAFPVSLTSGASGDVYNSGQVVENGEGMSLRDWFAGQMIPALFTVSTTIDINDHGRPDAVVAALAETAYQFADAMLTQRKKND